MRTLNIVLYSLSVLCKSIISLIKVGVPLFARGLFAQMVKSALSWEISVLSNYFLAFFFLLSASEKSSDKIGLRFPYQLGIPF